MLGHRWSTGGPGRGSRIGSSNGAQVMRMTLTLRLSNGRIRDLTFAQWSHMMRWLDDMDAQGIAYGSILGMRAAPTGGALGHG